MCPDPRSAAARTLTGLLAPIHAGRDLFCCCPGGFYFCFYLGAKRACGKFALVVVVVVEMKKRKKRRLWGSEQTWARSLNSLNPHDNHSDHRFLCVTRTHERFFAALTGNNFGDTRHDDVRDVRPELSVSVSLFSVCLQLQAGGTSSAKAQPKMCPECQLRLVLMSEAGDQPFF